MTKLEKIIRVFVLNKTDYFLYLFIASLSLFIRNLIPANILVNYDYDDFLGVKLAQSILNLQWLGGWDSRTLAKPAGYSIYLSVCNWMNVSPVILLHFIYLLASFILMRVIQDNFQFTKHRVLIHSAFIFMAFNPSVFAGDFSRIYRTSLNTVLGFVLLIFVIRFYLKLEFYIEHSKKHELIFWSMIMGILYSLFTLTRSEGLWLAIPCLSLILFGTVIKGDKTGIQRRSLKTSSSVIVYILLSASFGAFIPNGVIQNLNSRVYGVSLVENYYSGEFARAIKLWTSVEPQTIAEPNVFISKAQRETVYAVSANAKLMERTLEEPYNPEKWSWKSNNCAVTGNCNESGQWFTWEIRDAAVQTGLVHNEIEFQAFFKAIADDIALSCESGAIVCSGKSLQPGLKSLSMISKKQIIDQAVKALSTFPEFTQSNLVARPAIGGTDPYYLDVWAKTVKADRIVTEDDYSIWKAQAHVVGLLKDIYKQIGFSIMILIVPILLRRRNSIFDWQVLGILLTLLLSLAAFSIGIALFEISSGFPQALSLYTLPGQPIFMVLILFVVIDYIQWIQTKLLEKKITGND